MEIFVGTAFGLYQVCKQRSKPIASALWVLLPLGGALIGALIALGVGTLLPRSEQLIESGTLVQLDPVGGQSIPYLVNVTEVDRTWQITYIEKQDRTNSLTERHLSSDHQIVAFVWEDQSKGAWEKFGELPSDPLAWLYSWANPEHVRYVLRIPRVGGVNENSPLLNTHPSEGLRPV